MILYSAFLTAAIFQALSTDSDYLPLQSRTTPASSDLYKIFTNDDPISSSDKDVEKKVRRSPTHLFTIFIIARSKCFFPDYRALALAP